jgi:hypothetical protein
MTRTTKDTLIAVCAWLLFVTLLLLSVLSHKQ